MAITYPLTIPSTPSTTSNNWRLSSVVGMLESPFNMQQQIQEHSGQRWSADFTLPIMDAATAGPWRAHMAALRGPKGTFLIGDATRSTPQGNAQYALENQFAYSEQLDEANWVTTRASVTTNVTTAPDGTSTADKLICDGTAASSHWIKDTRPVTEGVQYRLSAYLKAAEITWARVTPGSAGFPAAPDVYFDLFNGVVGTVGAGVDSYTMESVGNGWYRCTVIVTSDVTDASADPGYFLAEGDNDATFDGNSTDGFYIWGAQFNEATSSSRYVKTTTSLSSTMAPAVNGANQTGNELITDGWATHQSQILSAGDWIQLDTGANSKLHMVVSDATTDADGNSTITIVPELRSSPADNLTVIYQNTVGLFRLAGPETVIFSGSMPDHSSINFSVIEAL